MVRLITQRQHSHIVCYSRYLSLADNSTGQRPYDNIGGIASGWDIGFLTVTTAVAEEEKVDFDDVSAQDSSDDDDDDSWSYDGPIYAPDDFPPSPSEPKTFFGHRERRHRFGGPDSCPFIGDNVNPHDEPRATLLAALLLVSRVAG